MKTPKNIIVTPFASRDPQKLFDAGIPTSLVSNKVPYILTPEEREMYELGVMGTVYVPVHPLVDAVRMALADRMEDIMLMYQKPHLKSQDSMHHIFLETFIDWSHEALHIQSSDFPHQYVTSGSSEVIRESIAHYGNSERANGRTPVIHIFEGEYEGYSAYATTHKVEVVVHSRTDYESTLAQHLKAGQKLYISAPSGIDGNVWGGYEAFLQHIEQHHPEAKIMLDTAYLNTTADTPKIRTDSPCINVILFSMSKTFPGTYYDRIGGVLSREEMPGLFGNKWFKSLYALQLGTTLMENSPLGKIPQEMKPFQLQMVEKLRHVLGDSLTPSNVTFIATKPAQGELRPFEKKLIRGGIKNSHVRFCLTPGMIEMLKST